MNHGTYFGQSSGIDVGGKVFADRANLIRHLGNRFCAAGELKDQLRKADARGAGIFQGSGEIFDDAIQLPGLIRKFFGKVRDILNRT